MHALVALIAVFTMASPAGASTRVVHWSPFAAEGTLRPGLTAAPAFGGDCYTGSFAVHSAYRCLAGHLLRDPCFADPGRDDAVVCVAGLFAHGIEPA